MDKKPQQDKSLVEVANRGAVGIYRTGWQLFMANLYGGLAWGAGSVLGATLVVVAVVTLVNLLGGVPLIGGLIKDLADSIKTTR